MIKKRILSFIVAVTILLPVFPLQANNIVKATTSGGSPPQATINGKQYDVTLSNKRIENGNEVYDAYVKIPDYNYNSGMPASGYLKSLVYQLMGENVESKGYSYSQEIHTVCNGNAYTGNLIRNYDLADDNSQFVDVDHDATYPLGAYNGTAYQYNAQKPKDFKVGGYIYNEKLLNVPATASVITTIPAEGMNTKLDLGSSIVATTQADTTANGIQMYRLSGKTIGGSTDLTKAFLFPTDGEYEITPDDMCTTEGNNPTIINKPTTDTFSELPQAAFVPGTFPDIESWQWRLLDRHPGDESHAIKMGNNYFFTAADTSLNDIHVTTTNTQITPSWCDVSLDIYLSNGSKDDAAEVAATIPNTITRDMYAFQQTGGIQYMIGAGPDNVYRSMSGSPMDNSDINKVYSSLQAKDPELAKLLTPVRIGSAVFSKSDTNSSIISINKDVQPTLGTTNGYTMESQNGYYLRMHGEYKYGECSISNEIKGTVNTKQYNDAIHYAGTVSRPLQNYNLNVNYVDEDTDNVIASDKTKTYTSQDVSTDDMFGANAAEQWYLPSYTPPGYTLDASKYTTDIGYHIIWDADSKYSNYNGRSTTDTVNLKVYCKKIPVNSYTLNISYIDEDTNKPISNIGRCETCKLYQESDLNSVSGGKITYYLPPSAPAGYTLDTSKYFRGDAAKGYGILFDDDDPSTLPHNGYSSNNIAGLQVYCKATAQKGTVVKSYFVDGIARNEDEERITDVPVGSHTYSADKSYPGYTCSNPSVTVNVEANKIAYCDFNFTKDVVKPATGTVIKRYFLKGVEQTADEKKIDGVETGSHTYSVDRTYPRYTCENTSVTVNVTANGITYCDFYYGFQNHPPTVHLYAPSTVVMGDNLEVNASGTDPDGDPLWYDWDTPLDFKGSTMNDTASGYFDSIGNKTFSVTVTDPYNASDYDSTVVKVVPPVPNVVIDKSGTEKENRKITLDAEKYSSSGSKGRYTLDWSKAKWQFFDGSGSELAVDNNPTSSTIVKSLQSTTGLKSMDLIFKKAGKYTAKCTLYNTAGYSNSFTVDLNITPDLAPTADYYFPDGNNVLRDPKDLSPNGLAQASHRLTDNSKSSDDNIGKRMWLACFDSDNDGSYDTITNNEDGTKKSVPEKERWYVYDLDYNGDSDTRYKVRVPDSTPLSKLVTIGSDGHKYAYVNDSLNPHWRYVGTCEDMQKLDINKINCGNLTSVTFKSTSVGNFDFEEVVQESFGQDTIPELITNNDIKQANTFNDK